MMSLDLRRKIFHGDILSKPMSRIGHWLFVISLITAFVLVRNIYILDVRNAFLMEQMCLYLIIFELIVVLCFRIPVLILAHIPFLAPILHNIKIAESQINRALCPRKVKVIQVPFQPYV